MDLQEYLNQQKPVRMPTVYLKEGEYARGLRYQPLVGRPSRTQIFIHAFPSVEYTVENDWGTCYTTDSDGNEMNRSVFYLLQPVELQRFPKDFKK